MAGVSFKITKSTNSMPKIKAAFNEYKVEAGILSNAGKHQNSKESVAQIAFYNEYGTPKIPERPAFRASFNNNRKKYTGMLTKMARRGFKGRKVGKSAFNALGREAVDDIQRSIVSGSWVANAPSTQAAKGRRSGNLFNGITPSKKSGGGQLINDPLVDTGQMLDSVSYRVKNNAN